jgi:hypothetical protein
MDNDIYPYKTIHYINGIKPWVVQLEFVKLPPATLVPW